MNIFEFLGLHPEHRKQNKVTQLVKHMKDVPISKHPKSVMVQEKKDGVHAIIVKRNRKVQIFGRTGKKFTNVEHFESDIAINTTHLDSFVVMAELCNPAWSLEELSGIVNPNRTKPITDKQYNELLSYSSLHVFDWVSMEGFLQGNYVMAFKDRWNQAIDWCMQVHLLNVTLVSTWPTLVTKLDQEDLEDKLEEITEHGGEGIVIRDPEAGWLAGHKGFRSMKMVRDCEYDLEILGLEDGKGKRSGMVANFICRWRKFGKKDGELVEIPVDLAGWSDDKRIEAWNNPDSVVGKVVKVRALQIGSQGSLRLAKAHDLRHDKDTADF